MKNNKGITLIALVITIIVLLILAGVSIAMLTGENGILTNAQDAKRETQQAEVEDKIDMTLNAIKTEIYAKQVDDKTYSGINADDDTVDSAIESVITKDLGTDTTDTSDQTAEANKFVNEKYSYSLDADTGLLTIYYKSTSNNFTTKGTVVLTATTTNVIITPATSTSISAN